MLHLGAPFAPAGAIEGVAVTRRAAEIDLQYRIATVGHELHGRIEAPEVTGSRTAMRVDDHGQVLAVAARRHGEEPGQFEPVSCGDRDGAHLPERLAIEPVIGDREFFEFVFVAIEKEIGRRVAAVPDGHNHLRLVFAHARGTDDALGKCRFDASDDRSPLRIDEMSAGPGIVIGHGNNVILDIRRPDTADIDIGMLKDELADRVVGEVVFIDCRLVALGPIGMDVRAHVHALAVIADPRGRIAPSGFFEFDEQVPVMLAGFPVVNTAFTTLEHEFTDDIAALVGQPAGDVARVEFDSSQAAVHDVHPLDVLDDHAVIEARCRNEYVLVIELEAVDHRGRAHDETAALDLGLGRFNQRARPRAVLVDGEDAERLVAVIVEVEQDAIVIGPGKASDVAILHPGDRTRLPGLEVDHGDVPALVDRRDCCEVRTIRRQLEIRERGSLEKILNRNCLNGERACAGECQHGKHGECLEKGSHSRSSMSKFCAITECNRIERGKMLANRHQFE